MPRTPAGEISKRLKAKAIRLLGATVDDESAPIYLRVMSARSLLAQPKAEPKTDDEDEFPPSGRVIILKPGEEYDPEVHHSQSGEVVILPAKVVILPSNGREDIATDRERERLERLAEMSIPDDDEPSPLIEVPAPAPRKLTGREILRRIRAKRRAAEA